MTRIADLLADGPTLSFEFFPPKTAEGRERLDGTVGDLARFDPSFVSVTYGAAGSTRDRTREVVLDIDRTTSLTVMPHLTCIAHRREELEKIVTGYQEAGLDNLLALHGDPPRDDPDVAEGDLSYARQLVELVRGLTDFSVGVAAHPEGHPEAPSREADRRHQAAKLQVADFGITQFFFRVEDYLRLVDDLEALGVDTPVIAGVIPITKAGQVKRFAELSGAELPKPLVERLDAAAGNPEEVRRIGVEVATDLVDRLLEAGAPGVHVYTLNRSTAPVQVIDNLGFG